MHPFSPPRKLLSAASCSSIRLGCVFPHRLPGSSGRVAIPHRALSPLEFVRLCRAVPGNKFIVVTEARAAGPGGQVGCGCERAQRPRGTGWAPGYRFCRTVTNSLRRSRSTSAACQRAFISVACACQLFCSGESENLGQSGGQRSCEGQRQTYPHTAAEGR